MKNRIVEYLEQIRQRPLMYIARMDVELMEPLIWGFRMGCFASVDDEGLHEKHIKAMSEVIAEHGWEVKTVSSSIEMEERGMSVEAMIDELLLIEIETWKRLLENKSIP